MNCADELQPGEDSPVRSCRKRKFIHSPRACQQGITDAPRGYATMTASIGKTCPVALTSYPAQNATQDRDWLFGLGWHFAVQSRTSSPSSQTIRGVSLG